jgi:mitochondrial fission protein ELM1
MAKAPIIWVLVDSRIGNANQAIELAQAIGKEYEIKNIEYNNWASLPSFFLKVFPIHIKRSVLLNLKKETLPDVVISAGRRTAALALYLKKLSNYKTKIIQIMRPNIKPNEFDLIILPQHDSFNHSLPNIVRIIGALTNVRDKIQKSQSNFDNKYPEIKNYIAVIIGGSTKGYKLTLDNARGLSKTLTNISQNNSLQLFITFSRRTPDIVKNYFKQNFTWPNIIYDPLSGEANPYPAILGRADYIISTTDSISMCSEAVSTGKPVYVFCPPNFKLKKHNYFIQQLVDLGLAKRLDLTVNKLEKYDYEPLTEISKVAEIINKKII